MTNLISSVPINKIIDDNSYKTFCITCSFVKLFENKPNIKLNRMPNVLPVK